MRFLSSLFLLFTFFNLYGQNDSLLQPRKIKVSEEDLNRKKYIEIENVLNQFLGAEKSLNDKFDRADIKDSINSKLNQLKEISSRNFMEVDTISFEGYVYYYCRINLDSADLKIFWNKENVLNARNSIKGIRDEVYEKLGKNLIFATNGGMFKYDYSPQGILIKDNTLISKLDTQKNLYGNFYIEPNGVFLLDLDNKGAILTQENFKKINKSNIKYATQSGPIVLEEGKINSYFNEKSINFNIRSGVGKIIGSNTIVFIISKTPVTFFNFSSVFKKLGCNNALYLDGAISEFYLPQLGLIDTKNRFGPIIGLIN